MTRALAICRRELGAYFQSPVAYAVLTVFLAVAGYFFYTVIGYYSLVSAQSLQGSGAPPELNLVEGVYRPFFSNIAVVLLFFVPMVSMRLFSEEMKSGTFELLFSYPIRDAEAVLGKFLASVVFLGILLGGILIDAALIAAVARPDWGPYLSAYLGLMLLGSAFLSLGIFASALTQNQIISAIVSFGALLVFMMIEWSAQFVEPPWGEVLTHLSIMEHFGDFAKGVIDTADLLYYILFSVVFLYATARVLELRRVRGF